MFTPLVLLVSCVVLSAAQTDTDDYPDFHNIYRTIEIKIPECNKPNEVLNHCVEQCDGEDSCYDRYKIVCPGVLQSCIPACVCTEGFIRKTVGTECIPKEECGEPCQVHEHYSNCKRIANESCSSILNPSKSHDSVEACTPGCTCSDGYYRDNETSFCLPRCLCPEMDNSPDCESWRPIKFRNHSNT